MLSGIFGLLQDLSIIVSSHLQRQSYIYCHDDFSILATTIPLINQPGRESEIPNPTCRKPELSS